MRIPAATLGEKAVEFEELWPHLEEVIQGTEVAIENSSSKQLDYSHPGRTYLVVGGNVSSLEVSHC